jgi:hypothetical protein
MREHPLPTDLSRFPLGSIDLMALALEHRAQANESTCLAEQLELHRVADIYEILATIDLPMSLFAEIYNPA